MNNYPKIIALFLSILCCNVSSELVSDIFILERFTDTVLFDLSEGCLTTFYEDSCQVEHTDIIWAGDSIYAPFGIAAVSLDDSTFPYWPYMSITLEIRDSVRAHYDSLVFKNEYAKPDTGYADAIAFNYLYEYDLFFFQTYEGYDAILIHLGDLATGVQRNAFYYAYETDSIPLIRENPFARGEDFRINYTTSASSADFIFKDYSADNSLFIYLPDGTLVQAYQQIKQPLTWCPSYPGNVYYVWAVTNRKTFKAVVILEGRGLKLD
jgi:hypothetical protein